MHMMLVVKHLVLCYRFESHPSRHALLCALQVRVERPQIPCYLTRTTAETHELIRTNLKETPIYGGWVDAKGPRYCPSIEDKIVRFADKDSHQACARPG
jgi:tRNA U34 5-carboxymethylaminomethyl modifying enzyme MnmG/GidA